MPATFAHWGYLYRGQGPLLRREIFIVCCFPLAVMRVSLSVKKN
jgi:hypothetical protein